MSATRELGVWAYSTYVAVAPRTLGHGPHQPHRTSGERIQASLVGVAPTRRQSGAGPRGGDACPPVGPGCEQRFAPLGPRCGRSNSRGSLVLWSSRPELVKPGDPTILDGGSPCALACHLCHWSRHLGVGSRDCGHEAQVDRGLRHRRPGGRAGLAGQRLRAAYKAPLAAAIATSSAISSPGGSLTVNGQNFAPNESILLTLFSHGVPLGATASNGGALSPLL